MIRTNLRILSFPPWQLLLRLLIIPLILLHPCHRHLGRAAAATGKWTLLQPSIGISAMHMQLLNNDRVVMYDRTEFGPSNISLPDGKCRNDTRGRLDCTAHSVEYDVATNTFRPLNVLTNVWCSSGSVMPNGTLVQTGGSSSGERVVRLFEPCSSSSSSCDWQEIKDGLMKRRWYATNHILPDARLIIIGGRGEANYEFYPKTTVPGSDRLYNLPFLAQTADKEENNLYPFVFLNVDGNLFIFANNRAILYDYKKDVVVKNYPPIPDEGNPRNYPSTGSAVLLPLRNLSSGAIRAEVLVCGGAPRGAFDSAIRGKFVGALNTCGRISINDADPQWVMETMPMARIMGDMLLLPNGHVLIINGASAGTAGWEWGRDPVLSPVIYRPDNAIGSRFEVQSPSIIPRMYHSAAVLVRDGRVLVGGSNPHDLYVFTGVLYPSELSLEAFSPSYLDAEFDNLRPWIILPLSKLRIGYEKRLVIWFRVSGELKRNLVTVTLVAPSLNTHSFSMNQRVLVLGGSDNVIRVGSTYIMSFMTPSTSILAPPGFYLLHVVHQDIPSQGIWVKLQ